MRYPEMTLIGLIGSLGLFLLLASNHAEAETTSTYFNQYGGQGNTIIANTYNTDGAVSTTYYNQYGNTVIDNTYDNQDQGESNE